MCLSSVMIARLAGVQATVSREYAVDICWRAICPANLMAPTRPWGVQLHMTNTWLIVNEASGSYDAAVVADIVTWFAQADQPVDCIIRCPDDDPAHARTAATPKA